MLKMEEPTPKSDLSTTQALTPKSDLSTCQVLTPTSDLSTSQVLTPKPDFSTPQEAACSQPALSPKGAELSEVIDSKAKKPAMSACTENTKTTSLKNAAAPTSAAHTGISPQVAVDHSLLLKRLMQLDDEKAKDLDYIQGLLCEELQPIGFVEEVLVGRMAYAFLRIATSAKHYCNLALHVANTPGPGPGNMLKYEAMVNRQFYQAMHELERLQRRRLGENVPAPLSLHISHDITTASDGERSDN